MTADKKYEQGSTSPFLTLAILIILGTLAYLTFDAINPADPSTMSISFILSTWLDWSWWAKGLSVIGPIVLFMAGSKLDSPSGFGKLPSDEE